MKQKHVGSELGFHFYWVFRFVSSCSTGVVYSFELVWNGGSLYKGFYLICVQGFPGFFSYGVFSLAEEATSGVVSSIMLTCLPTLGELPLESVMSRRET